MNLVFAGQTSEIDQEALALSDIPLPPTFGDTPADIPLPRQTGASEDVPDFGPAVVGDIADATLPGMTPAVDTSDAEDRQDKTEDQDEPMDTEPEIAECSNQTEQSNVIELDKEPGHDETIESEEEMDQDVPPEDKEEPVVELTSPEHKDDVTPSPTTQTGKAEDHLSENKPGSSDFAQDDVLPQRMLAVGDEPMDVTEVAEPSEEPTAFRSADQSDHESDTEANDEDNEETEGGFTVRSATPAPEEAYDEVDTVASAKVYDEVDAPVKSSESAIKERAPVTASASDPPSRKATTEQPGETSDQSELIEQPAKLSESTTTQDGLDQAESTTAKTELEEEPVDLENHGRADTSLVSKAGQHAKENLGLSEPDAAHSEPETEAANPSNSPEDTEKLTGEAALTEESTASECLVEKDDPSAGDLGDSTDQKDEPNEFDNKSTPPDELVAETNTADQSSTKQDETKQTTDITHSAAAENPSQTLTEEAAASEPASQVEDTAAEKVNKPSEPAAPAATGGLALLGGYGDDYSDSEGKQSYA